MKKKTWQAYLLFILLCEAVGLLAALLTAGGMENYATVSKPALTPPPAVFPVVWTVLYALMGVGAARVYLAPQSRERCCALFFFALQLMVNFFWSLFFFNLQAFGFAFIWLLLLWLLALLTLLSYAKIDRTAAALQLPYQLWLTFAAYLNLMVWRLNQ